MQNPTELRDAVKLVIDQNESVGYPPTRFRRMILDGNPRDDGATIGVDPEEGAADLASAGYQIDLAPDATRILVTVASEDGSHARTYVVIVGRTTTAQDATLSDIELVGATLTGETVNVNLKPAFTDDIVSYEPRVEPEVSQVTVWPFASNVLASVEVIPPDVDLEAPGQPDQACTSGGRRTAFPYRHRYRRDVGRRISRRDLRGLFR